MIDLIEKLKEFNKQQAVLDPIGRDSRVLLVDATNTYIRCFAATPTMNDDGQHFGGTTGFLKSVGLITRQFNPTRVICIFDGAGGSQRRRKLFENYKEKRKTKERYNRTYDFTNPEDEKEAMKFQMKVLIELLKSLPVSVFSVENVEADDVIAYLSSLVSERGGKSIIVSTDRDFLQLVSPSCEVYNPIKKKVYTESDVVDEFHIHPSNFLLYRVVTGDKSDNIPGVKGIGHATLIKNFPFLSESNSKSVEDLILACNGNTSACCEKLIQANEAGLIKRNHQLMNLREVNISGTTKLNILSKFDAKITALDKMSLTKLLIQYKLLSALGNFNEWITMTWTPLTRYVSKEN